MVYIQASDTLVASARLNVMASHPLFEFAPGWGMIIAGFNASAAEMLIDITAGTQLISERLVPLVKGTMPIFPDDYLISFPVAPNDRIIFSVLETAAATPVLLWGARFLPA